MICPKCGIVYYENDNFCVECGSRLVKNEIAAIDISKTPIVEDEVGSLDVRLVNKKSSQYKHEAKLADKQTIKLDILIEQNQKLIEQNGEIIRLLKDISEKKGQ